MPRRKQQAPKRAAVYVPDDESGFQESSTEGEGQKSTQAGEELPEEPNPKEQKDKVTYDKSSYSRQNSPKSILSNQEAELESRLSDVSDIPSDKSDMSAQSQKSDESKSTKLEDRTNGGLQKNSSTNSNFLSDSYWTRVGLGLKVGKNGNKGSCDSTNEGSTKSEFDWHQDALSKHFRPSHALKPASKTNLFGGVHLQRQSGRTCGSVFTGASRFRCRDCSSAYDTLVELTVHMNRSGHYHDDNHGTNSTSKGSKKGSQVQEGKEDAQKVLKCMFCGHSFDALQDLSVHMIKTKHYQKVPLKEPIPVLPAKLVPHGKKRTHEGTRPCSPDSTTGVVARINPLMSHASHSSQASYGYQNGASYTFQFETCKSQILKCMECGSSHETLQQLTAHMMVTGHFVKVTNSASKKGKLLAMNPASVEKMQSLSPSPGKEILHDGELDKALQKTSTGDAKDMHEEKVEEDTKSRSAEGNTDKVNIEGERPGDTEFKTQYLREEDLVQVSTGGGDILKSLANTVTSAINKAQTGTPSWSAYPSIHAAYQFSGLPKNSTLPTAPPVQLKQALNNKLRVIAPKGMLHQPGRGAKFFQAQHHSSDMKKENGGPRDPSKGCRNAKAGHGEKDGGDGKEVSPQPRDCGEKGSDAIKKRLSPQFPDKKGKDSPYSLTSNGSALICNSPEVTRTNPLSALQSVFNNHLGKDKKPSIEMSETDLLASVQTTLSKVSRNLDSPALLTVPSRPRRVTKEFLSESSDQPMDLTQSKRPKLSTSCLQSCTPVQRKHALSDIADMVKILPKATTPKPSLPSKPPRMKLETDMQCFEDMSHKRKGRQSNWNPQHLLILQAQFASSLFLTTEGKYLLSDLGPQERLHISKFTGLSLTTISHWLANVKYQLRKTGGTKFLKNMDSGHPVLHCNDCAIKFRTPSTFISHLESHLGFQIKDIGKLSIDHQSKAEPEFTKSVVERPAETQTAEDEIDTKFKCKLCCRAFVSNHAVKLHLSKTHSKSPENHSQFVEMDQE
ncbi:teashirt homolog 2-like [Conger conger]|uniref:teashirt homolog 2-like n=1 Tax=Conger conger TaxID=82655 RepID=UPI002A59EDB1|nr:teashirt homolog 2-like [Conger conger]